MSAERDCHNLSFKLWLSQVFLDCYFSIFVEIFSLLNWKKSLRHIVNTSLCFQRYLLGHQFSFGWLLALFHLFHLTSHWNWNYKNVFEHKHNMDPASEVLRWRRCFVVNFFFHSLYCVKIHQICTFVRHREIDTCHMSIWWSVNWPLESPEHHTNLLTNK